jgi:CBS domain-containing protein
MRVGDVMTTTVLTVTGGESLKAAARVMVEAGVSGLPVLDDSGSLVGIITEADFVRRQAREDRGRLLNVVLQRHDPVSGATTVGEAMTPSPIVIYPEATVTEAARVMLAHKVKRLPVVDDGGGLVGVVSRADLMSAFTIPDDELAEMVRQDVLKRVLLLDPKSLDVVVRDGVASISGEVPRRSDARILEELTRRLDGIVDVETDLSWEMDDTRSGRPPSNLP